MSKIEETDTQQFEGHTADAEWLRQFVDAYENDISPISADKLCDIANLIDPSTERQTCACGRVPINKRGRCATCEDERAAAPDLLAENIALKARVGELEKLVEESLYHLRLDARAKDYHERALASLSPQEGE